MEMSWRWRRDGDGDVDDIKTYGSSRRSAYCLDNSKKNCLPQQIDVDVEGVVEAKESSRL
jgi:hypothetical protein